MAILAVADVEQKHAVNRNSVLPFRYPPSLFAVASHPWKTGFRRFRGRSGETNIVGLISAGRGVLQTLVDRSFLRRSILARSVLGVVVFLTLVSPLRSLAEIGRASCRE